MPICRFIFLSICGLAVAVLPARAAVVVDEYALRGTLADTLGGPALGATGGQITPLGYVFAANQGLTLSNPALSSTSFSIELSFKFDVTSGYRKIADFHNLADDTGLYQLNGNLNFYPVTTASQADFAPGVDVHLVLTRDGATNTVVGYVNGQQRFSFLDTSPLATITAANNRLTFFIDDFATSQGEASGGMLNYLRLYNGALTATEVSAAFAAGAPLSVPEPGTAGLLVAGGAIMFVARRRSRDGTGPTPRHRPPPDSCRRWMGQPRPQNRQLL